MVTTVQVGNVLMLGAVDDNSNALSFCVHDTGLPVLAGIPR